MTKRICSVGFATLLVVLMLVGAAPPAEAAPVSIGTAQWHGASMQPEFYDPGGPARIDDIALSGVLVNEGNVDYVHVHVGPFTGRAYESMRGFDPPAAVLSGSAPLTGETASGAPVTGSCTGGTWTRAMTDYLTTTCSATVDGVPTGTFTIRIGSYHYCVGIDGCPTQVHGPFYYLSPLCGWGPPC